MEYHDNSLEDIEEFFMIFSDKACLDGWFSAEELRRIAEAIEKASSPPES